MSAAQAIKIDSRREEQFNDIVANIKPFGTVGKGKNQKTIIGSAVVPLSLCYVNERYQRMREHKKIQKLERNWDIRKLTPIVLVPHYEECRFALVDGNGRSIVAPPEKDWTDLMLSF